MEKLYEQANDLHVRGIMFYPNSRGYAFLDQELEEAATVDEFVDAFIKGTMVICDGKRLCKPLNMIEGSNYITVSYTVTSPVADSDTLKYIGVGKLPNLGPS